MIKSWANEFSEARLRYNYELGYHGGYTAATRSGLGAAHFQALAPATYPAYSLYHLFFSLPEANNFIRGLHPLPTYTVSFDVLHTLDILLPGSGRAVFLGIDLEEIREPAL